MKRLAILLLLSGASAAAQTEHPRLFLTPARIAALRQEIQGARKEQWEIVRKAADSLARRKPPALRANDAPDQLWQRDVGNAMPQLAMAWLLTVTEIPSPFRSAAPHLWATVRCIFCSTTARSADQGMP